MTMGSPLKLLLAFTIPLFLGNLFQQFYSMVDSIVVGRFVGVEALAALGTVNGFSFMVIGFAQGLAQGFSVLISQRYGAGDKKGMRRSYAMSILNSAVLSIIIALVFFGLSKPLLYLINTPENIIDMANDYISIIYLFLFCSVFYNLFSSVLRAVGDSKSPVLFLLIASILNIILDLVFVVYFHWDVKGVGIATVLSQGISAFISILYINKRFQDFRLKREDWKFDKDLCIKLLKIGLPGAFQFSVCAIGVIIVQAVLNKFGSDTIAAYSVGTKIESIITQFMIALGMAISTFAGQNLGAVKLDRIRKGFRTATMISIVYALIATLIAILFSKPMSYIFVDSNSTNPEVIKEAVLYVRTVSFFFIPLGFIFVYRTGCQGLGSGGIPMLSSIIELTVRSIAAYALPLIFSSNKYLGICLSSPAAWICAGFILPFVYMNYMKKIEKRIIHYSKN